MTTFREQLKGRFATLAIIAAGLMGLLVAQLWGMQLVNGQAFTAKADKNRLRTVTVSAARGRVLDAHGRALVTNRPVTQVTLAPETESREDSSDVIGRLATEIGVPTSDILKALHSYKAEPLAPRVIKTDVPVYQVDYLVEHAPEFPGVQVVASAVRSYPSGIVGAHVLGYAGEISQSQLSSGAFPKNRLGDTVGKSGVEAEYDSILQGTPGYERYEVDAKGHKTLRVAQKDPVPGSDIKLTIDAEVQKVAEKALREALAEAHRATDATHPQGFIKAKAGAIVVIDAQTGAVVAMASAPTFDPGNFVGGISPTVWASLNASSSEYPMNNRAIMGAYPPGSTFKAVTGMAALQDGLVTAHSTFDCTGYWTGFGKPGKWCWNHAGHGGIDFTSGIEQSCDTVFYELGKRFFLQKGEPLQDFARSMGLGALSGIDLPGEWPGRVPDKAWQRAANTDYPENQVWLGGYTVNMAIGQGDLLATPLQMACYYAALGNGGKVMQPHVLQAVLDKDGTPVTSFTPVVAYDGHLSAENLAIMRSALHGVTSAGTAQAAFSGFPVAVEGKTGTSQVLGKDDFAWFACYASQGGKTYAVSVLVEQGGHGGSVAAPAARQVLSKLFGVPWTSVHATDTSR